MGPTACFSAFARKHSRSRKKQTPHCLFQCFCKKTQSFKKETDTSLLVSVLLQENTVVQERNCHLTACFSAFARKHSRSRKKLPPHCLFQCFCKKTQSFKKETATPLLVSVLLQENTVVQERNCHPTACFSAFARKHSRSRNKLTPHCLFQCFCKKTQSFKKETDTPVLVSVRFKKTQSFP